MSHRSAVSTLLKVGCCVVVGAVPRTLFMVVKLYNIFLLLSIKFIEDDSVPYFSFKQLLN